MSTAQVIFEQYKVLPKDIKEELVALILDEQEEFYDDISLPSIKRTLEDINLLKEGKLKTTDARQFLSELEQELAND